MNELLETLKNPTNIQINLGNDEAFCDRCYDTMPYRDSREVLDLFKNLLNHGEYDFVELSSSDVAHHIEKLTT